MAVFLLIIGLIMFIGLVVVHEFGHFIAAKRSGVDVEEFGVGFPPRAKILSKKGGTIFSLNWLPLGGFVKLKGEHDSATDAGSFGSASLKNKVKIMLAGVLMNLLAAFLLFTLLAVIGLPKLVDNQFTIARDAKIVRNDVLVGTIEAGSPADKVGLKQADKLVSVEDGEVVRQISKSDDLRNTTKEFAGQTVGLNIERNGEARSLQLPLRTESEVADSRSTNNPKGYLGVVPTEYIMTRSTWSSPIVAVGIIKQFSVLTFQGLGSALANLFRGDTSAASSQVSGPVGIFVLLKNGSLLGYQFILMIIAIISLTLAIMNVLPIPALDGGRLFVTLFYRIIRRPLGQSTEERIHGTGFAVLMLLFVLITIVDVRRNF